MSVPVPSTPTNPDDDDLRKRIALAIAGDTPDAKHFLDEADAALSVVNPVLEGLRRERDAARLWNKAHETNNAALGKTNRELAAERDALSSLLRGMARRVGEVREEMRFATKHVDGWRKRADRLMSQRDKARAETERLSRPSVSDQTPATPREIGKAYIGDGKYVAVTEKIHDWPAPSSVQGDTTPEEA